MVTPTENKDTSPRGQRTASFASRRAEERDVAKIFLLLAFPTHIMAPPNDDDVSEPQPVDRYKAPSYTPNRPDMFFAVLESQFKRHKVIDESQRFSLLINAIDLDTLDERAGSMVIKEPDDLPYTTLKAAILEALKPADYNQVRALMQKESLGTTMPTDFLARLIRIADPEGTANEVVMADVKDTWLRGMPPEWCTSLLTFTSLKEAAKSADVFKLWKDNPLTQGIYQAATGMGAAAPTMPVAAVSAPVLPLAAPQVAATTLPTDVDARLARMEDMMSQMSKLIVQTAANRPNTTYRGRNNNANSERGRSQSPARINNGLCWRHERFGAEAHWCHEGCQHYNQFMADKGSRKDSSN